MTKIVVVDLDGTLCNSAHREHLAKAGQWDEFHALLMEDQPWQDVAGLLKMFEYMEGERLDAPFVVALTGRNEKYRTPTINWLARHDLSIDALLMRPDDDYRSDHELKPQLLNEFLSTMQWDKGKVMFILEDRDKVVEAWRDRGFTCFQVRPGGY